MTDHGWDLIAIGIAGGAMLFFGIAGIGVLLAILSGIDKRADK